MRTRRNSRIILINLVTYLLFLLPVRGLDLYKENYSTLSLHTKGYFFLLFLGIMTGFVMAYETMITANKKRAVLLFLSMVLGTCIPHEYPYQFRGHFHLLFAYLGGFGLIAITYLNLFYTGHQKIRNLFHLVLLASLLIYMKYAMVNTLIEILIMSVCLFIHLYLFLKTSEH